MGNILKKPVTENDHHQGPLNAPVVLVEYGDFECPYSAVAASVIEQLVAEYRSNLCFVYRHFILSGIHPEAEDAALAAEAAGKQGEFWHMHKLLFENQENLSKDLIHMLARKLRLDMEDFEHDMQSYELMEKIKSDHNSGVESGIEATPVLFINGIKFEGSSSYWPLREAIEAQIGGASATM